MRTSSSRPNERRLGRITLSMTHVAWRRQPALRSMDGVSSMIYTYSSKGFLFLVIISQALWRLQSFSHVLLASARTAAMLLSQLHEIDQCCRPSKCRINYLLCIRRFLACVEYAQSKLVQSIIVLTGSLSRIVPGTTGFPSHRNTAVVVCCAAVVLLTNNYYEKHRTAGQPKRW